VIKRREFIAGLSSAVTWPLAGSAQQLRMPAIGYLVAGSNTQAPASLTAFRKGLGETGFFEGSNVKIDVRVANDNYSKLSELAADLVFRGVDVIVVPGGMPGAHAARALTKTIPIVFATAGDPVQSGLVDSLNRPGGNVTGVSVMDVDVGAKRLELLHELLPKATSFAVLVNPNNPLVSEPLVRDLKAAVATIHGQIEVLTATNVHEIDVAFATFVQKGIDALLLGPSPLFTTRQQQIRTLATRHAVPAWAAEGGLMSYGSNNADRYRLIGIYTGRVLKGEKPADLPVLRPTKFEFVINLQTARALGVEVPPMLLALADEVIE
jgi:putative ABC transport system substrate-binding protein